MDRTAWETKVQSFEAGWWGDCANTYGEETKQIAYAKVMGFDQGEWHGGDKWPAYFFGGANIIDVGGGPSSMLLKTNVGGTRLVVDPCDYPDWTRQRYEAHGIQVVKSPAEDFLPGLEDREFHEAWLYNVLQHTLDPESIVRNMRRVARNVRIFEWIDTPPHPGHPHTLRAADLDAWVGAPGQVVWLDETYNQIDAASPSAVRQPAWGGLFT